MRRLFIAIPVAVLLGCSTPAATPPSATLPPLIVIQIPPPDFQRDLPLEQPQGHLCQLGKSCMALDPRPFEACLVSGAPRCADKVREPLLVGESLAEQPRN